MFTCICGEPGFCPLLNQQMPIGKWRICAGQTTKLTREQCDRYRALWAERAVDSPLACQLRGEQIDSIACSTCVRGRTVRLPVFACPLHGRCIPFGTNDAMQVEFAAAVRRGETPELWQCNLCRDRVCSPAATESAVTV